MKAYKITGKLGDICSFVGGNEVKKGDMVYFHSESDMKQQCVAKTQENDMSIEAMKQALEALEMSRELDDRGLVDFQKYGLAKDKDILVKLEFAITALRQAIEQAEKQYGDQVIRSIKQEAETGLVVGDKVGMRDALQQILREADKHLGIEV